MDNKDVEKIISSYRDGGSRILFLDYDGTLTPFRDVPSEAVLSGFAAGVIRKLASSPGNDLVIISGRDRFFLESQFRGASVTLVAEHGLASRLPGGAWVSLPDVPPGWKEAIISQLRIIREEYPGSTLEEKESSVAFHYRGVKFSGHGPGSGDLLEKILRLKSAFPGLEILPGKKVFEVKQGGYSKGTAATALISQKKYDFILAAGDDCTDETLFRALRGKGFTIKIGQGETTASYRLPDHASLLQLLEAFL